MTNRELAQRLRALRESPGCLNEDHLAETWSLAYNNLDQIIAALEASQDAVAQRIVATDSSTFSYHAGMSRPDAVEFECRLAENGNVDLFIENSRALYNALREFEGKRVKVRVEVIDA